jgi:hypothetical protein
MAYKKVKLSANKTVFYFDSLRDVEDFTDEVVAKVPTTSNEYRIAERYFDKSRTKGEIESNIRSYGEKKYGTTSADFVGSNLERYVKIDDVEDESRKLTDKASKYDFEDIDQVKKIEFTEKEIGIFSFDLASLGLVRVYEYYSPLLKKIVSPNLVKSEVVSDGKKIFVYVGSPYIPKHKIEYVGSKGGYYSNILMRLVDKKELFEEEGENKIVELYYPERQEIKKHEVERKQATNKDGSLKFATTFKKCFINIPKIQNTLPRVDIIVPVSYSWGETSDQVFWNSIALVSICERLSDANVNYRVIACYGTKTSSGNKYVYDFVNIKNENQPLDKNQLSLLVSDMRFFRVQMFRTIYATQYEAGYGQYFSSSIGSVVTDNVLVKEAYMDYLEKQSSESDRMSALNTNSKIVVPYANNERTALYSYNTTICKINGGTWNSVTNTCEKN